MSYYNQPDHELLDRRDDEAQDARCSAPGPRRGTSGRWRRRAPPTQHRAELAAIRQHLEQAWLARRGRRLREPDRGPDAIARSTRRRRFPLASGRPHLRRRPHLDEPAAREPTRPALAGPAASRSSAFRRTRRAGREIFAASPTCSALERHEP